MIYYCHIPKTSGTSIDTSLILNRDKIKFRLGGDSNELENENKFINYLLQCKNDDIIKGHYAATPFEMFPGVKGYSILREPMDRLLSAFRFSQKPAVWKQPFENVLYLFLTNKNPTPSMGFDGTPNIQSLFLTQPLEWIGDDNKNVSVKQCEMDISDVLRIIKKNNITLSTMENRTYMLDEISSELKKTTNNNIIFNHSFKTNENPFKMDVKDILPKFYNEIYKLNKLDFDLYNYVNNHEKINNRALSPSDIIL